MRVLLADDHRLLLEGLANLLDAHGIQVAGMARDGLEAVALARSLYPDVILMDIRMPNCDGLRATRLIKTEQSALFRQTNNISNSDNSTWCIPFGSSSNQCRHSRITALMFQKDVVSHFPTLQGHYPTVLARNIPAPIPLGACWPGSPPSWRPTISASGSIGIGADPTLPSRPWSSERWPDLSATSV